MKIIQMYEEKMFFARICKKMKSKMQLKGKD